MSYQPIQTITRRDVRDAFSDWRTTIPLLVLSGLLPLILGVAVRFAANFLDEADLTRVLIPFGMLIAGFLPASFSLIGPLEAFVGERERNTLESLLSAPISDRGLYLSKFIASLTPPLISSFLAMGIYALNTELSEPEYANILTVNWMLLIALIIVIKAIAMVAAAVYISSQSTSIRGANLLASFILIPMTIVVQAEAVFFVNENFGPVIMISVGLVATAVFFLVLGIRRFNREDILGREHSAVRGSSATLRGGISNRRHGAVFNIVRREVRDTLSDWRILAPILVLTVLMPILAVGGTIAALSYLENTATVTRLMPFIFLLVGFLPASFSLITALEVFVGEKERGSLESLFSMPISDAELYLGKLLSALLPPIGSGLLAMLLFTAGYVVTGHSELLAPLTPPIYLGMIVLSIVQAIMMVAGAVIISSHTSSVRVANLLASFILLPLSIIMQYEALLVIATRYDIIFRIGAILLMVALILMRSGLQSFNRESILSREHLSLNLGAISAAYRAFFHEIRPAGADPDRLAATVSLRRFYGAELKVVWREIRRPLIVVLIGVVAAIWYGTVMDPEQTRRFSRALVPTANIGQVGNIEPFSTTLAVFIGNSLRIWFSGIFSAFSFGFMAWLVPATIFLAISKGATWSANHAVPGGAMGFLMAYVIPHGIIELPTAILMAAVGVRVGAAMVSVPPTYTVGRHLLWAMALYNKVFIFVGLPLLFLGAVLEGFLTPVIARMVYGL